MTAKKRIIAVAVIGDPTEATRADELSGLITNLDLEVIETLSIPTPRKISPSFYFPQGVRERLQALRTDTGASEIIVDAEVSERHIRNLSRLFECTVRDRTDIILTIFSERAKSREGRLQVALAFARYRSSRLVRSWTHLERQRGGTGALGGPGEAQLELDRRDLLTECDRLEARVAAIRTRRTMQRKARRRSRDPHVALVGYTNAGKTRLFNALTHDNQEVADKLFATLDPVARQFCFVDDRDKMAVRGILVDSVGFIRDLPPFLQDAFQATFEEIRFSDLLIHVVDGSDALFMDKYRTVQACLDEMTTDRQIPRIVFINKCEGNHGPQTKISGAIYGSAHTGLGLNELRASVRKSVRRGYLPYRLPVAATTQPAMSWFVRWGVLGNFEDHKGVGHWQLSLNMEMLGQIQKKFPGVAKFLHPKRKPKTPAITNPSVTAEVDR